jgi:hypothetical protein
MSEIKVNKISPRTNCGTVTLGDSGDSFTIPSGATITNSGTAVGFGATGSASWVTTVKTTGFTAVAGEGYFVNTTSGAISVNLPAGTAGAVVAFKDYADTFDTDNLTLVQNGSDKIGGSTNNAIISTEGAAVTLVFVDSTKGWLVTDDGLQSEASTNPFICATGGTITNTPTCRIHTFTGPGNFVVNKAASDSANNLVSYVVIAGGGGGGGSPGTDAGGGGGAGGYREVKSPVTPYTASPLCGHGTPGNRITVTTDTYPIVVGAGGSGGAASPGPSGCGCGGAGNNSTFSTVTSAGGGRGQGQGLPSSTPSGANGGSGAGAGGGNGYAKPAGVGNTPPTTPSQGNPGGTNVPSPQGPPDGAAGGGGGAGSAGTPGSSPGGGPGSGPGGNGTASEITGSPVTRAGGGGGGTGGSAGPGGGANGGASGCNATANTGGGGGAGGGTGPGGTGGNGGSGIVIIRYKIA